ncbi:hypothetical protein MCEMIH15_03047 [Caulobacteraceae bacterium]
MNPVALWERGGGEGFHSPNLIACRGAFNPVRTIASMRKDPLTPAPLGGEGGAHDQSRSPLAAHASAELTMNRKVLAIGLLIVGHNPQTQITQLLRGR